MPPYLCIAGPTASGKTAAALALARLHPVEIISVDSALVYRGMDIGTAKPSADELAQVPHHLINIRDPLQPYSAAEFVRDAEHLIADIHARGNLPLLVGGTMLYFKALLQGIDAMPSADAAVRAALEAEAQTKSWPALHAELALVDPLTAARLSPNDSQRIQRALEVYRVSGLPLSHFHAQEKPVATHLVAAGQDAALARVLFSLEPENRSWLHERVAQRFDAMLAQGLVDEVRTLRARGDLHADLPSMRCVGYRQTWLALDADPQLQANGALAHLRELGIAATRQLAKRQITWLRSMPQRRIIFCDQPGAQEQFLSQAMQLLKASV